MYREPEENHFLQLAVCLTPYAFFNKNLAGITKRWDVPVFGVDPPGRAERVGPLMEAFNQRIQAPLFANAGTSDSYSPDGASFLQAVCAEKGFMRGILKQAADELDDMLGDNPVMTGGIVAAVGIAGGGGLLALAPALAILIRILRAFIEWVDDETRLGEYLEKLRLAILGVAPDPVSTAAGVFVWQMISYLIFQTRQGKAEVEAISYAVMDQHDYHAKHCEVNVDSVEVFFKADDPRLAGFIDKLIDFEIRQESQGKATVGYAAIRIMGKSRALLAMQKWDQTASVEVSCLKDVPGGPEMIADATSLALEPNFGGYLHWGQRNEYTQQQVQERYGDKPGGNGDALGKWRAVLSRLTDNGRLDGFSSAFTQRVGLEVVQPVPGAVTCDMASARIGDRVTLSWDAKNNPPGTEIWLHVWVLPLWSHSVIPDTYEKSYGGLPMSGSQTYDITSGTSLRFELETRYTTHLLKPNQEMRSANSSVTIGVTYG